MKTRSWLSCIDTINEWVGRGLSFLLIPLMLITTLEVILRYFFNRPTIWVWDVNIMLLATLTMMAGGYVLLHGGHVIVDTVVTRLSPRGRAALDLVTSILFFLSVGVLVWQYVVGALDSWLIREKITSVWAPPIYPLKTLLPIGAFLLLLQGLAKFVRDLDIVRSGGGRK